MKDINLFYKMRDLFNVSEEEFELFHSIKQRIRKDTLQRHILFIFINNEFRDRSYKKAKAEINAVKYYDYKKEILTCNGVFTFATIGELKGTNFLYGQNFTEVKFLG